MNQTTASIVLATRNRHDKVLTFLKSVASQTEKPQQIIIIDSSDQPLNTLESFNNCFSQSFLPDVQLQYSHTEAGLTYQRNQGIELSTNELTYFFDDDVILDENYIYEQNKMFHQHPEYAAGMGNIKDPNTKWSLNRLLRIIFLLQRENASGNFTFSGMPTHAYGQKISKTVSVLGGCNMGFRTSIVKEHLFDEHLRYYSYMEDCDISKRISLQHKLFYNPLANVDHIKSELNRDKLIDNRAMYIKNYSYLFFKNFYSANRLRIFGYYWTIIGLFVEAIFAKNLIYIKGYIRGLKQYNKK